MAGIYVHIPFCKSRCIYCDFYSTTRLQDREEYVRCIEQETALRAPAFAQQMANKGDILKTVYFGGGTPSVLSERHIDDILCNIRSFFRHTKIEEITLEANPGDLSEDKLRGLKEAGINRLSMGVQSFQDALLHRLSRRHNGEEAIAAVRAARRAGFENISIDLMYGLPEQTMAQWQADVEQAIQLDVEHVSAYCLTYEDGTPLYRMLQDGAVSELDEDLCNQMQDYLEEALEKNGVNRYEISNYAKDGYRSKHNSSYWTGAPYLGLGAGAHSYDGAYCRQWNPDDIGAYMAAIEKGELPLENEILSETDRYNEAVMLGLRTSEGLDLNRFSEADRAQILTESALFLREGLLKQTGEHIRATHAGTRVLNRLIEALMK